MTEQEWLDSTDPRAMLYFLRCSVRGGGRVTERQLRLFACAGARRLWDMLADDRSRRAVETAERYADGLATRDQLAVARDGGQVAHQQVVAGARAGLGAGSLTAAWVAYRLARSKPMAGANDVADWCPSAFSGKPPTLSREDAEYLRESGHLADLLRDIIGPRPFRPVVIAPSLLTTTVASLARGIYDENAFDRMPYLADALMDAGCENEEALAHCKGPNGHVKGCWLIDALLGLT